jgi:hypothetical protein
MTVTWLDPTQGYVARTFVIGKKVSLGSWSLVFASATNFSNPDGLTGAAN